MSHDDDGDEIIQYETQATYQYEFRGTQYTGTRVTVYSYDDYSNSEQSSFYRTLGNAHSAGVAISCRVNPEKPKDSVLFWKPDPSHRVTADIMALLLTVFGGAIVGAALLVTTPTQKNQRAQTEYIEAHIPLVSAAVPSAAYIIWIIALEIRTVGLSEYSYLGFWRTIVPVFFVCLALYYWLRKHKFGTSTIEFAPDPPLAGSSIQLTVLIPREIEFATKATLRYIHEYKTRSGNKQTTRRDTIWTDSKTALFQWAEQSHSEAKFQFELPQGHITKKEYSWRLELRSPLPGVNYYASFDITVHEGETHHTQADPPG
ncbi:MAG: DUF3592 domain-containing protein [Polyangiaceae bacterium]|nr:DUF3592 domain-containing protein [Polyangiaceae bacterium]